MRVVLAPTAFKGTASPLQAARRMAEGWSRARPSDEVVVLPVADGGDGTLEVIEAATGGRRIVRTVRGPLGDPVEATALVTHDGTGVVEMASASGLVLVGDTLDPWHADTRGTGELVAACFEEGADRVVVGLGGSATVDGGAGYAHALGVRFLDANGRELEPCPETLRRCAAVDLDNRRSGTDRVEGLTDVRNPLLGPDGAAPVYGPQKGVGPEEIDDFADVLARLVDASGRRDAAELPGAGAAGGLGFGIVAFGDGRLSDGAARVLDLIGFDEAVGDADLVVTGEGKLDRQTASGKAPAAVAQRAAEVRCVAVCGVDELGPDGWGSVGLERVVELGGRGIDEGAEELARSDRV